MNNNNNNSCHERTPLVHVAEAKDDDENNNVGGSLLLVTEVIGDDNIKKKQEDTTSTTTTTTTNNLDRARRWLYLSHFFAQFSERAWQFALVLFLAAFANYKSLVLVSSYGLLQGLAVCLLGSRAGQFVDHTNRLFAARALIWSENLCVLIATAFCCSLLLHHGHHDDDETESTTTTAADVQQRQQQQQKEEVAASSTSTTSTMSSWVESYIPTDAWSIICLIGIHVFGPLAQLLDQGFTVAIEKDWIVSMSQEAAETAAASEEMKSEDHNRHNKEMMTVVMMAKKKTKKMWLSETNVTMKRIDLTCKVVAPAVAGFVIGAFDRDSSYDNNNQHYGNDLTGAAVLVGFVNVAALVVEYVCTSKIYDMVPSLAVQKHDNVDDDDDDEADSSLHHQEEVSHNNNNNNITENNVNEEEYNCKCEIWKLPYGLSIYLNQRVAWAGIGLAMLYLNALTFGALMTAYMVYRGMRLETVGIWRGVSSAVGLAGTFVYHYSAKRMTIVSTGMWSICYQFVCLSLSFCSLFMTESYDLSMALLIFGVCMSRIGLWVFDISVTQLMQELIPDGVRGVVGGTQQSLNAFFSLLTFALCLVFPDPKEFHIYVAAGYSAVGLAAILYAFGVYRHSEDFLMSSEKPAAP